MGTRVSFLGGKVARREVITHLHLVHGDIPPLSQYTFTAGCSVKAQGQLPFTSSTHPN